MKRLGGIVFLTALVALAVFPFTANAADCTNYPPGTPQCPQNSSSTSSGTVSANGFVSFDGCCFDPDSTVNVSIASTPRFLGSTTAFSTGSFHITVRIPGDETSGTHTLIASGTLGGAANQVTASIVVTNGGLTPTGTNTIPFVVIGVGIVAVGGTLFGVSRRKTH